MDLSFQPPENQPDLPQNGASEETAPQQEAPPSTESSQPKWEPLNSIERRVAGVLVEKAKTTPDAYPLTLNALCNGCNQKSNRSPVMQLEPEQVEEALESLRQKGAVFAVQGGGRVEKFRHNMYEWLGVSKQEIAVMTELLLRGDQSQGELRARAARMESIASLSELKPVVQALKERGLVIPLTPEGRGHILTHNLYKPREMEKLQAKYSQGNYMMDTPATSTMDAPVASESSFSAPAVSAPATSSIPPTPTTPPVSPVADEKVDSLQRENEDLRVRVSDLDSQVAELTDRVEQTERALRELRDALGG